MMQDINLIVAFVVTVVILLVVDLLVIGRKSHAVTTKEAGIWTFIFVAVSLLFAAYIYYDQGSQKATEFLSAYVIEKTLSVDNLFVFILIFGYFKVPAAYQHKVLFWGVLGAIILRAIFIFAGVKMMSFLDFHIAGREVNILVFGFGIFLVYAGIKAMMEALNDIPDEEEQDFENSAGAKFVRALFKGKVSKNYDGDKFTTTALLRDKIGRAERYITVATPLLVVVGVVEFTDLLFAVDSIPAIFSVSKDPFILYSSNIFAILGLRSMYFLLANMLPLFKYLKHGVALILAFIGMKMVTAPVFHIDGNLSLYIVLGILVLSILISLSTYKKEKGIA